MSSPSQHVGDSLWPIELKSSQNPLPKAQRDEILANPGFGKYFTDHMVTADWTQEAGWHNAQLVPYGPLSFDPATNFMHYGQAIFEGLKAYRHEAVSYTHLRAHETG
jgi:branched-chain amino acid aminotransferase